MLLGIAVMLVIVVIGVAAFSISMASHYYQGVRTGLVVKASTSAEFFTTYVTRTYAEYYQSAWRYAEEFEDKDKLELQLVNTRGRVDISSYGITAGTSPGTPDIASALDSGSISVWTGRSSDTGERLMSVSSPLIYTDGTVIGVMRFVTSLRLVDRQVIRTCAAACAVGLAILLLVSFSNLYFIRTITVPISSLTTMAKRIADGSYGIQLPKQFDDEIGDLTDAINEMSAKIGKAEAVQTEFISSVSHELRTPLTAITGWSETLLYDPEIQGDSRRGVSIISKEAGRLTKMVEELLEFTRIQDGRFTLNIAPVDAAAELEDSVYTYIELFRQEGVELIYEPSGEDMPLINGDAERLKQVFLNILDNAAKYGREGRRVVVRTWAENGEWVCISIRDFGSGVPEEELPHITKKFYKGSSKERGSGIGLAVCEEIVTRHKGTLSFENAEGGGLLVTIKLPVLEEQSRS